MVSCIKVISGIGTAQALFAFGVKAALDGGAGGISLVGDLGAVPKEAAGDGGVGFFDDAAGVAVVDELIDVWALGDFYEAVFGIPLVSAQAVAEGVAVGVVGKAACGWAGDVEAPAFGADVGRGGGVVGGFDGEGVRAGGDLNPCLIEVFWWGCDGCGLAVYFHFRRFVGVSRNEDFSAVCGVGDLIGVVVEGAGNCTAALLTAAITCFVVLVTVALGDGSEIGHGGDGSRGELIDKVIAEGHLGGGGAAELALPSGDVAVFEVGVIELAEGAGGVACVGEVVDGFEAVVA